LKSLFVCRVTSFTVLSLSLNTKPIFAVTEREDPDVIFSDAGLRIARDPGP